MATISLSDIRRDGGTQTRAAIDPAVAIEYGEAIRGGAKLPPVVVFYDGSDYWLADGFHRVTAYDSIGQRQVECDVRQGTKRDAVLYSVGANSSHGLRRTNADKRRAVETLLRDEEWAQWSDVEIGRRAGTSHTFVAKVRAEVQPATVAGCRKGADGKTRALPTKPAPTAPAQASLPSVAPKPPAPADDFGDDDDDVAPVVYEPDVRDVPRDPPKRDGWGAVELQQFIAEHVICVRDFERVVRERFAKVDPRFATEARARTAAIHAEVIEVVRGFLPSEDESKPRLTVVR